MTPKLFATIMLWSASTNPVRHRCEDRANHAYASWSKGPAKRWWGKSDIEALRDSLNDLVNCGDEALLYEGDQVVGIKPEMLPDFRAWCERYGMDGGGL